MTFYQKAIILLFLSSFAGEVLLIYLKNLLIGGKNRLTIEAFGLIERALIGLSIIWGGYAPLFIFIIVPLRWLLILNKLGIKGGMTAIRINEPAMEYQKIKLKSELLFTLLASPTLGIIFGVLVRSI